MKIVINNCYGGFSLNPLGLLRLAELKDFPTLYFTQGCYKNKKIIPLEEAIKGNDLFVLAYTDIEYKNLFSEDDYERNDKHLVQVVEELGKKADGRLAELKIVEIPDNVKWNISYYDGMETVEEEHQSWS